MRSKLFSYRLLSALSLLMVLFALIPISSSVVSAQSDDDSNKVAWPFAGQQNVAWMITQDCHNDGWGTWCALDAASMPARAAIHAPISGTVSFIADDGYKNPTVTIDGFRYMAKILHADFTVRGGVVAINTVIGTEGNNGNVRCADGEPPTRSKYGPNCGYHFHFDLYDKVAKKWIDPRTVINTATDGSSIAPPPPSSALKNQPPEVNVVIQPYMGYSPDEGPVMTATPAAVITILPVTSVPQYPTAVATGITPQESNPVKVAVMIMGVIGLILFIGGSNEAKKIGGIAAIAALVLLVFVINDKQVPVVQSAVATQIVMPTTTSIPPTPTEPPQPPTPTVKEIRVYADLPPSHEGGNPSNSSPSRLGSYSPPQSVHGEILGFPDRTVYKDAPQPDGNKTIQFTVIASYYVPNWGGVNCSDYRADLPEQAAHYPRGNLKGGWCWSTMSSGQRWEEWYGYAVACPASLPFGTKIYAFGREWQCLDHGGKIVQNGNAYWIDFLTYPAPAAYGSTTQAVMVLP